MRALLAILAAALTFVTPALAGRFNIFDLYTPVNSSAYVPYLVSTLPPCNAMNLGMSVWVTDAATPVAGTLVGGGANTVLAVCNSSTHWVPMSPLATASLGYTPLAPGNNLSDVSSVPTAVLNIGLSTTVYPTHAALIAGVTAAPSGPWTFAQQGFSTAGGGGDAIYQWNASSFCPGNTNGVPASAAGDGLVCILPSGQSQATAGRLLLSTFPSVSVTQLGFMSDGTDNASLIPALMNASSPSTGLTTNQQFVFPSIYGNSRATEYYFSSPLDLTHQMEIDCQSGGAPTSGVNLVFAAGVDGVITDQPGSLGLVAGGGAGPIKGCGIFSLGKGNGNTTQGSNTITSATVTSSQTITAPGWAIGDGVIISTGGQIYTTGIDSAWGSYLSNVSGSTLTLDHGYAFKTAYSGMYRLPAALAYNVTTMAGTGGPVVQQESTAISYIAGVTSITVTRGCFSFAVGDPVYDYTTSTQLGTVASCSAGSTAFTFQAPTLAPITAGDVLIVGTPAFTVTGGNTSCLHPGDLVWSDAFPFGSEIVTLAGPCGAQRGTLLSLITNNARALATHNGSTASIGGDVSGAGTASASTSNAAASAAGAFAGFWSDASPAVGDNGSGGGIGWANAGNGANNIGVSPNDEWLEYDFGASAAPVIVGYSLFRSDGQPAYSGAQGNNLSPASWNFQYSDDNTNWYTVDAQTGQVIGNEASVPAVLAPVYYSFASAGGHRYWRIDITGAVNGGKQVNITQMTLNVASTPTGKLWEVPAGIKHRWTGRAFNNQVVTFPIALSRVCNAAGLDQNINCTNSWDEGNFLTNAIVGSLAAGSNPGASVSLANVYSANTMWDIGEFGTVGSSYYGETLESGIWAKVVGNCNSVSQASFFGFYTEVSSGGAWKYCWGGVPQNSMPIWLGAATLSVAPSDIPLIIGGIFQGYFNGRDTVHGCALVDNYVGLYGMQQGCITGESDTGYMMWTWDYAGKRWLDRYNASTDMFDLVMPTSTTHSPSSVEINHGLRLPPVLIANLPTCNSNAAGLYATVSNGLSPTYGGSVGSTGSATAPVFCDGASGWTYH
jgi:hypothetical protein